MIYTLFSLTESGISILQSLYKTLARAYDFLLQICSGTNVANFSSAIEGLANILYALVGVFMLFRITISLISMLLDPDRISDQKVGARKIITNVIVTIVLLILFQPTGLVYNELHRFENAMLGTGEDNGFISNILSTNTENYTSSNNYVDNNKLSSILISDVKAASPLTCYFVSPQLESQHGIIKLTIYDTHVSGSTKIKNSKDKCNDGSNCVGYVVSNSGERENFTYKGHNRSIVTKASTWLPGTDKGTYSISPKPIQDDPFGDYYPTNCSQLKLKYEEQFVSANKDILPEITFFPWPAIYSSQGYSDIEDAYLAYVKYLARQDNKDIQIDSSNTNLIEDIERMRLDVAETAKQFASSVMKTTYNCNSPYDSVADVTDEEYAECQEIRNYLLNTDSSTIRKLVNDEVMDWDFIMGALIAVAFIIWIVVLCIEVIIRNLKLILLQMIAPIPIVNGIDPNDKMRSEWFKMYFSTYVSLFLKLFSVKLVCELLKVDMIEKVVTNSGFSGAVVEIFYIIALLCFAKAIPDLLSKVFGLSNMSGSFKDIGNMVKKGTGLVATGAGVVAGATIGGAVGAATGKGIGGRLGGFTSGVFRGAGSGSKRKILGGAKEISERNARISEAKANGLHFWDRKAAEISGAIGYSSKNKMDSAIKDKVDKKRMLDNFSKHKDNIEGKADSSNYLSDQKAKLALNPDNYKYKGKTGKDAYKQARSDFIALNETNRINQEGSIEYYNPTQNKWIDSKQSDNYVYSNGQVSNIKFENGANGKIKQAEKLMQNEISVNTSLQRELNKNVNDVQNFATYEQVEKIARNKSNDYEVEINKVEQSDEYIKAQAMDDYLKRK